MSHYVSFVIYPRSHKPPCRRIQEEGLRTYLFTYAPHYKTLSLSLLSRTFSLQLRTVTSIVSKMIWSEELPASLDQAAGVIVFNCVELSRSQQLAQVLAEKVGNLVEQNEKTLDYRLGGTTGWGDRGDGGKGDKRGEQPQERRGRGERTRGGAGARGKVHGCSMSPETFSDYHFRDQVPVVVVVAVSRRVWGIKCRLLNGFDDCIVKHYVSFLVSRRVICTSASSRIAVSVQRLCSCLLHVYCLICLIPIRSRLCPCHPPMYWIAQKPQPSPKSPTSRF